MNRRIAAGVLTAAIAGGGTAGVLLTNAANAADGTTSTTTAPAAGATAPAPPTAADRTARRTAELTKTLQGLVDSGKITAEQRDAVIQAIIAAQPAGDKGGPGGFGGFGGGRGGGFLGVGPEVAKALGIDAASLRTALEGGKSIADVAKEKGIAVDTVVQAVVAAETARIGQAVTDGKLTQAQADARKADLTARATAIVNGTLPAGMPGMPGGHGPRGQGPAGVAPSGSAPAAAPSGSSFNPSGQGSTTA